MKVFDLRCTRGHGFEGWFASEKDYQDQNARGLVACPLCGIAQVDRTPSAPRLNLGAVAPQSGLPAPGGPIAASPQTPVAGDSHATGRPIGQPAGALWQAMREAVRSAEDVGTRFAGEARRIHEGDAPERGIRGQASAKETRALLDDGILVLPVPPGLKETLQ